MSREIRARVLLLTVSTISVAVAIKDPTRTLLNRWPFVMAHDAATTYLKSGALRPIHQWAKTQADGGAAAELDCGARAFDWRPKLTESGKLVAHHGDVEVTHEMGDSLDEMVAWCGDHNATEDLVVLGITDCDGGDACSAAAKAALSEREIHYVTNCTELKGMSVAAAAAKAALPNGGSLIAMFDCWKENYVPEIACSGYETKKEYTCYEDSSTKGFPLQRMFSYLAGVSAAAPPDDGQLYAAQALWQETTSSVVVGELHASSLLLDESRSTLNSLLVQRLRSGAWNGSFNLVEVNNVCDSGVELLSALHALP